MLAFRWRSAPRGVAPPSSFALSRLRLYSPFRDAGEPPRSSAATRINLTTSQAEPRATIDRHSVRAFFFFFWRNDALPGWESHSTVPIPGETIQLANIQTLAYLPPAKWKMFTPPEDANIPSKATLRLHRPSFFHHSTTPPLYKVFPSNVLFINCQIEFRFFGLSLLITLS